MVVDCWIGDGCGSEAGAGLCEDVGGCWRLCLAARGVTIDDAVADDWVPLVFGVVAVAAAAAAAAACFWALRPRTVCDREIENRC